MFPWAAGVPAWDGVASRSAEMARLAGARARRGVAAAATATAARPRELRTGLDAGVGADALVVVAGVVAASVAAEMVCW